MTGYPIGTIALVIVAALIYFGLGQRALDRLYLTDKAALALIVAMILGDILIFPFPSLSRCICKCWRSCNSSCSRCLRPDKSRYSERVDKSPPGCGSYCCSSFSVNRYVLDAKPWQTNTDLIDPIYLYPILAGLTAYIAGRSGGRPS